MLASPVPTHRPWWGSTANAPVESVGASSVRGVHVPPESFHTPPSAEPAYNVLPSAASAVVRPPTTPAPPPELLQFGSRKPLASLLYDLVVISLHGPPTSGRFLAAR